MDDAVGLRRTTASELERGPEVVVAIPSFRRPESLTRLLRSLAELKTNARLSVLVADNDAAFQAGLAVCARVKPFYRWPLDAFLVPERGIAQVRNALVERALLNPGAQYVAMVDDDEWVDENWLDAFLAVQRATGADLVQGSILFEESGRRWDGAQSIRRPTGRVAMVEGAGNLLVARSCLGALETPYFDPAFALTGGEDRDFFVRLARAGKSFAWADDAIAYAAVPHERLGWRWGLKRAFSIGNSDMRVLMKHRPRTAVLSESPKIVAGLLLAPILLVAFLVSPEHRFKAPQLLARAAGKAMAILRMRYDAYADDSHGS